LGGFSSDSVVSSFRFLFSSKTIFFSPSLFSVCTFLSSIDIVADIGVDDCFTSLSIFLGIGFDFTCGFGTALAGNI